MGCETLFLKTVKKRLTLLKEQGEGAMKQLGNDEQVKWMPNPESNSIALIVKHLHGNMKSRWTDFLTSDGEKPDRDRPSEFYIDRQPSIEQMWDLWNKGWGHVFSAIENLTPEDLSKTVTIRNEPLTVIDAIIRQLLHYSAHIGQMVYLAKILLNEQWISLSIPRKPDERYSK